MIEYDLAQLFSLPAAHRFKGEAAGGVGPRLYLDQYKGISVLCDGIYFAQRRLAVPRKDS